MTLFVKRYDEPWRAQAAKENYSWIVRLGSGVLLPSLVNAQATHLAFTRLDGVHPTPSDLSALAATIGQMHHAAAPELIGARLDKQHTLGPLVIGDFTESRRIALRQAANAHHISPHRIDVALDTATELEPAFYKDSNLRNFILTSQGIAVIDFDDLTLAPYGYDLAKLITSMGMTFGAVSMLEIIGALDTYNIAVGHSACTPRDLAIWAELNWLLTANYLGRNGYVYPWPKVRPWTNPLTSGAPHGDHH